MNCSVSQVDKLSERPKIWPILSERLSYVVDTTPTDNMQPFSGLSFQKRKAKQTFNAASNCNPPCKNNNGKYYGIQH